MTTKVMSKRMSSQTKNKTKNQAAITITYDPHKYCAEVVSDSKNC